MAHILIDGYNLIGIAHKSLERARQDLIQTLHRYAVVHKHSITVVFDGWKDGEAAETKMNRGGLTVIYSGLGEKADDLIKHILASAARAWIVVSSDRGIYDFAVKKGFAALKAAEFAKKLQGASETGPNINGEAPGKDDEDVDRKTSGQKGNPKKLSKREKKKTAALKKL